MLQQAPIVGSGLIGRVDFDQKLYEDLIAVKGRKVLWEMAMPCPCQTDRSQHLPSCKNCSGVGWLFVNPVNTSMIVKQVNIITDYKPWSEEMRGTATITAPNSIRLSNMDRVSLLESESVFSETLQIKEEDGTLFSYFTYAPITILAMGLFIDVDSKIEWLPQTEYEINGQYLTVQNGSVLVNGNTITVRYIHRPVFHIIELQREVIETYKNVGGVEKIQKLPISAVARRAHYLLGEKNLQGSLIFDNSFPVSNC